MLKKLNEKRIDNLFGLTKKNFSLGPIRIYDNLLYIIIISFLALFPPDIVIIFAYFFIFLYLYISSRKNWIYYLCISSLVSLAWIFFANSYYGYNIEMLNFFGLNSFPLFAWAIGLFGVYFLFSNIKNYYVINHFRSFLLFCFFYWSCLLLVETIGYHVFNIQNLETSVYQGLPLCNCIHAPVWMQISYFLLGPAYFILCKVLTLKKILDED